MRSLRRPDLRLPEPPRERLARAGRRHLARVAAAFAVTAFLLNAPAMLAGARATPFGFTRDANIAVLAPFARVVSFFGLDRPRAALDEAFHPVPSSQAGGVIPASTPTTLLPPTETTLAGSAPAPVPTVSPGTGPEATAPPGSGPDPTAPPTTQASDVSVTTVRATVPPPPPRTPTAAEPMRVLVVGDSFMESLGASLERAFFDTGVASPTRYYKPATGLARPDVYSWPAALAQSVADFRPEAAIIMLGGNDGQNLVQTGTGAPLEFGSDPWLAEYHVRVGAAMDALAGVRVYWIGMPSMRDADFGARVQVLNSVYEAEAGVHPGVTFVPTWTLYSDASGAYQAYLPDASGEVQRMRADDGVHFTRAGADRLSGVVLTQVLTDFGVALAST